MASSHVQVSRFLSVAGLTLVSEKSPSLFFSIPIYHILGTFYTCPLIFYGIHCNVPIFHHQLPVEQVRDSISQQYFLQLSDFNILEVSCIVCSDHIHLYHDEHVSEAMEIRRNVLILCTEKIHVCVCPVHYVMLGQNRQTKKGVLKMQGLFTFLDLVIFLRARSQEFQCN